jgi:glutaredoxin
LSAVINTPVCQQQLPSSVLPPQPHHKQQHRLHKQRPPVGLQTPQVEGSLVNLNSGNMLTLYVKPGCPYCKKVLEFGAAHSIQFTLKDIVNDEGVSDELIARGGKRQVPYLVDDEAKIEMYESGDIVAYLDRKVHEG